MEEGGVRVRRAEIVDGVRHSGSSSIEYAEPPLSVNQHAGLDCQILV